MSIVRLQQLGLRTSRGDPVTTMQTPKRDQRVFVRRKFVALRIPGFGRPILIPFNYSDEFYDDLLLISWRALADHYVVVPLQFNSLVFARGTADMGDDVAPLEFGT